MLNAEQQVPVFGWSEQYAMNIPEIDNEHQILFGIVNRLGQALKVGEGRQNLAALLEETVRYAQHHFAHEESLMAAAGFPELQAHKCQHADLTSVVRRFQRRFESGETTMTIELMQFLMYWLRSHTTTSDRRFGQYLATTQGQTPAAS